MEGCNSFATAQLVNNGKIVTQVPVKESKAKIEWQILPGDVKDNSWYRFDIVDLEDQGLAISNPIFFGSQHTPESLPFGRFLGSYSKA